MKAADYEKTLKTGIPLRALWDWHERPGAFERLVPPWQRVEVLARPDRLEAGAEVLLRLRAGPFSRIWRARIEEAHPCRGFIDTQAEGPLARWRHEHRMEADGETGASLTDRVTFTLPWGLDRFRPVRNRFRGELERLFTFRHRRMSDDFQRYGAAQPGRGRTVLMTGASGLIGSRLKPLLETLGFSVRALTRGPRQGNRYHWDPGTGELDPEALDGVDAVVHLAGENIAGGLWTASRRRRILDSRVLGTRLLVGTLAGMRHPPRVLVSASGVNFYGSGNGIRDENSPPGDGFLAEVCRQWEAEALKARDLGMGVCCMRTGIVLDPGGGALAKMLPAFRLGLGGPVGSGRQSFPWIAMDDLVDLYAREVLEPRDSGPLNAVHPQQLDQRTFSRLLGRVLRRPARLPLPARMVRLLLGQMGEETLLADLQIRPLVLEERGHPFRYRSLEEALAVMLGRVN